MAEVTSELKNKLAALIKHERMLEATADQVPTAEAEHTPSPPPSPALTSPPPALTSTHLLSPPPTRLLSPPFSLSSHRKQLAIKAVAMQEHSEAEKAALIAAAEKEAGSLRAELSSGQAQLREASERSSMLQRCNEQLSDFQARAREEADLWRQVRASAQATASKQQQQRASRAPQPSHTQQRASRASALTLSHTRLPSPRHRRRDGGGGGDDDGE